jgi:hypothetical protein
VPRVGSPRHSSDYRSSVAFQAAPAQTAQTDMIESAQMYWLSCDTCRRNPPERTRPLPSRTAALSMARADGWLIDRRGLCHCQECVEKGPAVEVAT